MYNTRNIFDDLIYIGCSDRKINLFESAYPLENGVSYNSYLLQDEKTVLFDTVDKQCAEQFYENLEYALNGRNLDYIVVQHMEPDHCALLENISNKYSSAKIICSNKTAGMIKQFFNFDIDSRVVIVKEGETFSTGKHELQFFMAPMVHWPEVMVTYDKTTNVLFTADAFGSFGAINGNIFDNEINNFDLYLSEAGRYYTNIVGKYGLQVQMLLKKLANLDVKMLCPLHGLLIQKNIEKFIKKYDLWSKYEPVEKGVLIVYTSVYGGTENAVNILATKLSEHGINNIKMFDASITHSSYILSEAFNYSHIVLATTTYNAGIFESMESFLNTLVSHNLQNRKYILIQNGSWAPACGKQMQEILSKLKGSEIIDDSICIKSTLKKEQLFEIENVVNTIVKSINS